MPEGLVIAVFLVAQFYFQICPEWTVEGIPKKNSLPREGG